MVMSSKLKRIYQKYGVVSGAMNVEEDDNGYHVYGIKLVLNNKNSADILADYFEYRDSLEDYLTSSYRTLEGDKVVTRHTIRAKVDLFGDANRLESELIKLFNSVDQFVKRKAMEQESKYQELEDKLGLTVY